MIVIGITGGIGSGKSTVSQMMVERGAAVIDADKMGHEVLRPGTEAWREVVEAFGKDILNPNGEIDRSRLARKVFGDDQAIEKLNRIVHPRMYQLARSRLEGLRREGIQVAVLEAPLLYEANWLPLVDEVWVTYLPQAEAIKRLRRRNGLSAALVKRRLRHQMPPREKARRADRVIDTRGTLEQAREQVEKLWQELMASRGDDCGSD